MDDENGDIEDECDNDSMSQRCEVTIQDVLGLMTALSLTISAPGSEGCRSSEGLS